MAQVVSPAAFKEARAAILVEEKAVTKTLEELAAKRRALPRVLVPNPSLFKFTAADGSVKTLSEIFEGRQQLMLYQFMLVSGAAGCTGCSFVGDAIPHGPALNHLLSRSVTFCCVAAADIETVNSYNARMGWTFPFYSSPDLFKEADDLGEEVSWKPSNELYRLAVFLKDDEGRIYHTYETSNRGVEVILSTYALLDMTPLGRREDKDSENNDRGVFIRHDEYDFVKKGDE
ncbi:hypothetical protein DV736_g2991, partial [Chaetothyriales sp. CBS 134916]